MKKTRTELIEEIEYLKKQLARYESIHGQLRNISDEKQKYHQIVENSPISIIITNVEGEIEYVNPFFSELTGYSYEEVIGEKPSILKSGYHNAEFYKEMWDTITGGQIWQGEFLNKKKNNQLYWESATIGPVLNSKGEITNFVATKADITEKKESEEKFKQLAEQSPNMIFINQQGRIVYANKLCEEITGYTKEEFYSAGFDFRKLIDPEYIKPLMENFKMHLQGKEVLPVEYAIRTKRGERIETIINTKLVTYGDRKSVV